MVMKRLLLIALVCLLSAGCRTAKVIEQVPVYVHDTTAVVKEVHDSTYIDRWHTEYLKGDTVFVRDSFAVVRYFRTTDTAYKVVERPITVTRTETVEVEKRLHWWQKGLMWMGVIGLLCVVGWIGIRFYRKKLS